MKKICVITGTRAEYGLLKSLMSEINQHKELQLQIIATGMHLSPEFGLTYREIQGDGFVINEKVEMMLSADTPTSIATSMGIGIIGLTSALKSLAPDMVVLLGDRYEIFAGGITSMILNIPIAHIHGGELTYGVMDENIRHSLTKMSYLHFTATEEYRNRVIQLGESPDRVFHVGSLGVESIHRLKLMSKIELEESIDFSLEEKYALVTFHPVARDTMPIETQFQNLLDALDSFPMLRVIFTYANSDTSGRIINQMIDTYVAKRPKDCISFISMGQKKYLSAMKFASLVIGNSSSGIIEAPSFHVPTINIGDRQKGRTQAGSVINTGLETEEIRLAMKKGLSEKFNKEIATVINPYDKPETAKNILEEIVEAMKSETIHLDKEFYDIPPC